VRQKRPTSSDLESTVVVTVAKFGSEAARHGCACNPASHDWLTRVQRAVQGGVGSPDGNPQKRPISSMASCERDKECRSGDMRRTSAGGPQIACKEYRKQKYTNTVVKATERHPGIPNTA
jgi:hypothetical protein